MKELRSTSEDTPDLTTHDCKFNSTLIGIDILQRSDVHNVGLREYVFKQQYLKKPEKKDKKYPEAEDFMRILYKPDMQTLWGFHNMLIPR
jgi:hypothetical protein